MTDGITPKLMRDAAPLTVTVFDHQSLEQFAEPVLVRRHKGEPPTPSGYWFLCPQYEHFYTNQGGLSFSKEMKYVY